MKVAITEQSKECLVLAEVPIARALSKAFKEENITDIAKTMAYIAGGTDNYEIFKATAEIAKNGRIYDYYDNDTRNLDVWLEIYAFNEYKGFYEIGAYLSDIWQLSGENTAEIRSHMYIRDYKHTK